MENNEISLYLNGERITPRDAGGRVVPLRRERGVVFAPLGTLGKALGVPARRDPETRAVSLGRERGRLAVIGEKMREKTPLRLYVDGNMIPCRDPSGKTLSPFERDGTVYVPVRPAAEALGVDVREDADAVRLWSRVTAGEEVCRLIFAGDWDGLEYSELFREKIRAQFRLYPRLLARFGTTGREPRTVLLTLDDDDAAVWAYTLGGTPFVTANRAFIQNDPAYTSFFIHEFAHAAQSYPPNFKSSWWTEHLANYSRFRYYLTADPEEAAGLRYSKDDPDVRDWHWGKNPYGKCEWFFAYLDDRWPTRRGPGGQVVPGLIDTLHRAVKDGTVLSDGGDGMTDPDFNAIVRAVTGFENLEAIRLRYVRDMDEGAWEFAGFAHMEDSFLTEDVRGQVEFLDVRDDLLRGAPAAEWGGSPKGAGSISDQSFKTCWFASQLKDPYVIFDLGASRTFDTCSLFSPVPTGENSCCARSWDILASEDRESWRLAVSLREAPSAGTCVFPPVTGRYVMLRLTGGGDSTSAVYSLMLFNTGSGGDALPETWEENGVRYTGFRRDGALNGAGRMTGSAGTYMGSFRNGIPQGSGRFVFRDGSIFTGSWLGNQLNGRGELRGADGSRRMGVWQNGMFSGAFRFIDAQGKVFSADCSGSQPVSWVPVRPETWTEGGVTYTGCRVRGLLEGQGTFTSGAGTYTGRLVHGKADGQGAYVWTDGRKFTGVWDRGTAYGVLYESDGTSRDYVM